MCQTNNTTKILKWKQLIYKDRLIIEYLFNVEKKNFTQIAVALSKHRTTISREIKSGMAYFESCYLLKLKYCADIAQRKNKYNETNKGPNLKIGKDIKLAKYIETEIKKKMSPEVIAYKIKTKQEFLIKISYKTIYNYIEKKIINITFKELICGKYRIKKRTRKEESERIKANKKGRTIHERPSNIENREEFGHWEMDLVEGKKGKKDGYLLVLSERKSRKEIIEKVKDKSSDSVAEGINRIEKREGVKNFRKKFKTITTDNGSEFKNYEKIEKSYRKGSKKRTNQYYADAYSSWQRGTNENTNKLIRRFIPKGSSIKEVSEKRVKEIEKWINDYPRKMFNFRTSAEIYEEEILKI